MVDDTNRLKARIESLEKDNKKLQMELEAKKALIFDFETQVGLLKFPQILLCSFSHAVEFDRFRWSVLQGAWPCVSLACVSQQLQ